MRLWKFQWRKFKVWLMIQHWKAEGRIPPNAQPTIAFLKTVARKQKQ